MFQRLKNIATQSAWIADPPFTEKELPDQQGKVLLQPFANAIDCSLC